MYVYFKDMDMGTLHKKRRSTHIYTHIKYMHTYTCTCIHTQQLCICFGELRSLRSLWLSSNLLTTLPIDEDVTLMDFDPKTGTPKMFLCMAT